MSNNSATPGWKVALGIGFAVLWAAVGAMLMTLEGQRAFENTPAFAGRVMGQGMAIGLVAALFAHVAALRQAGRKVKVLNYLAAMAVGAVSSWLVHGG